MVRKSLFEKVLKIEFYSKINIVKRFDYNYYYLPNYKLYYSCTPNLLGIEIYRMYSKRSSYLVA